MPANPQAIVVIGVAGSGKTTVARELALHYGDVFLDADDFHTADAKAQMASGVPLTDDQREPWIGILQSELRVQTQRGRSCVLAYSGLRAAHRQRLRASGVRIRFVFLHAPPLVIAARLAMRGDHFMPFDLLSTQFDALQWPMAEPDVVAVDVSGSKAQVLDQVIAALEMH